MEDSQRPKKKSNIFGDSKLNKKKIVFDENWFTFSLIGGPIHSELLVATATIKVGEKTGQPLPLDCKWFNINPQNELKEIEGVSGGFYQPCVDDVGSKIYVQATPMIGTEEYQGMPVFAEVGPLVIDKEIENKARTLLDSGSAELMSYLISSNFTTSSTVDTITLPTEVLLKVTIEGIQLQDHNSKSLLLSIPLGESYPVVVINKLSNSLYEIHTNHDEYLQLNARENIERDIIAVAIRMFCGKKILLGNVDSSSVEKSSIKEVDSGSKEGDDNSSLKLNSPNNSPKLDEATNLSNPPQDNPNPEIIKEVKTLDFTDVTDESNHCFEGLENKEPTANVDKIEEFISREHELSEPQHENTNLNADIIIGEIIREDSESNASEKNNTLEDQQTNDNLSGIVAEVENPTKAHKVKAENKILIQNEGSESENKSLVPSEESVMSRPQDEKFIENAVKNDVAGGIEANRKEEEFEGENFNPSVITTQGDIIKEETKEDLLPNSKPLEEDNGETKTSLIDTPLNKEEKPEATVISAFEKQAENASAHLPEDLDAKGSGSVSLVKEFNNPKPESNLTSGSNIANTEQNTAAKPQRLENDKNCQEIPQLTNQPETKEAIPPNAVNTVEKKKGVKKEGEPAKSENSVGASYDILMKIEQLTRDNKISLKEKENLSKELSREREMRIKWEKKYNEEKDEFDKCIGSYAKLNKENEILAGKNEEFAKEKIFYAQELNLFQAQIKAKEDQMADLEQRILEANSKVKNQANMTVDEVEELQNSLKLANDEKLALKNENKVLKDQLEKKLETVSELTLENENLENKLNHLKKKHESLVQETQKSLPGNKKLTAQELKKNFFSQYNQQEERISPSAQEWSRINITNNTKVEDLRVYILKLESTVEGLKQEINAKEKRSNYDNVLGFISSFTDTLTQGNTNANQQIQYLQKLANTLTETIADREISIENHRKINRELMKKVNEMETKLKIQEELEKLQQAQEGEESKEREESGSGSGSK